jgi:hypothetical protein
MPENSSPSPQVEDLTLSIYGKSHEILWTHLALLVFAIVFWVIGSLRVSEFNNIGLSKNAKAGLGAIHLIGTALFSIALGLLALDIEHAFNNLISYSFVIAVFILFPLHIYIAIRRRLHAKQETVQKEI